MSAGVVGVVVVVRVEAFLGVVCVAEVVERVLDSVCVVVGVLVIGVLVEVFAGVVVSAVVWSVCGISNFPWRRSLPSLGLSSVTLIPFHPESVVEVKPPQGDMTHHSCCRINSLSTHLDRGIVDTTVYFYLKVC